MTYFDIEHPVFLLVHTTRQLPLCHISHILGPDPSGKLKGVSANAAK